MLLSDQSILQEHEKPLNTRRVLIHPFDRRNIGPNSYDVRLHSEGYFVAQNNGSIANLHKQQPKYVRAQLQKRVEEDQVIWGFELKSGQCLLGATHEAVGGRNGIVPMLHCRSTVARCFVRICNDAGFGDEGFFDRWAIEIRNDGPQDIFIPCGVRIGQFSFEEMTSSSEAAYNLRSSTTYIQQQIQKTIKDIDDDTWDISRVLPPEKPLKLDAIALEMQRKITHKQFNK